MKEIPLSQGKVALVDDEDYERLNQFHWFAHKVVNTFYAERHPRSFPNKRAYIKMHAEIIHIPKELVCDHIDGNGLNNQKCNLHAVTKRQNAQNLHIKKTSKYPGVCWNKSEGKWNARICIDGKRTDLGRFKSEEAAALRYKLAAMEAEA
jgi:hypothetical protein